MITPLQRAAARQALVPLNNDHEFYHKADVLKRTFPQSVLDDIKAEIEVAKEFNKNADEIGGAILTPEAGAYWEEVQLLVKRGKAAQARGDKGAESEINKASERLQEAFDERVPDHDKPKFKQLDPQNHKETWDDDWAYIEFPAPLLRDEFASSHRIASPRNYGQRSVLTVLGQPPVSQADEDKAREQGKKLRQKLAELRGERTVREVQILYRKLEAGSKKVEKDREDARRYLAKKQAKEQREAEIKAGLRYANGQLKKKKKPSTSSSGATAKGTS